VKTQWNLDQKKKETQHRLSINFLNYFLKVSFGGAFTGAPSAAGPAEERLDSWETMHDATSVWMREWFLGDSWAFSSSWLIDSNLRLWIIFFVSIETIIFCCFSNTLLYSNPYFPTDIYFVIFFFSSICYDMPMPCFSFFFSMPCQVVLRCELDEKEEGLRFPYGYRHGIA